MEDNKWAFKYIIFCLYITFFFYSKNIMAQHTYGKNIQL